MTPSRASGPSVTGALRCSRRVRRTNLRIRDVQQGARGSRDSQSGGVRGRPRTDVLNPTAGTRQSVSCARTAHRRVAKGSRQSLRLAVMGGRLIGLTSGPGQRRAVVRVDWSCRSQGLSGVSGTTLVDGTSMLWSWSPRAVEDIDTKRDPVARRCAGARHPNSCPHRCQVDEHVQEGVPPRARNITPDGARIAGSSTRCPTPAGSAPCW